MGKQNNSEVISQEIKEIAAQIGEFYFQQNEQDFDKTRQAIEALRISKIEFTKCKHCNSVTKRQINVVTCRPGLLIGKRGQSIEALEKYLGLKIFIIEDMDNIEDWLIPQPISEKSEEIDVFLGQQSLPN